jgi:hypothetical protein
MKKSICAGFVLIAVGCASLAEAISASDTCEAAKNQVAGRYAQCRSNAEARAIRNSSAPAFARCDTRFSQRWSRAESNANGLCLTSGDQSSIQTCVTTHTDAIAAALDGGTCTPVGGLPQTGQTQCESAGVMGACPGTPVGQDGDFLAGFPRSFTDNGDGTITSAFSRLQWEKLGDDASIHDKDTTYTWSDAILVKIAALNSANFAGHADWRLPNIVELHSMVNFGTSNPATYSAFSTGCTAACSPITCSCTIPDNYFSSTTDQGSPSHAWIVNLGDGAIYDDTKLLTNYVRAVRGGS